MAKEGQSVFTSRKTEFCPACLDRDAIDLLGRPRYHQGAPCTFGCEVCGAEGQPGNGKVWLDDRHRADPYARP